MSRLYTTAALLQSAAIRCGVAAAQELYPASEQLLLADQIMLDSVIPMVREQRGDHFMTYADQTTTTATAYAIPTEAMNRGIRSVTMVTSSGLEYALTPIDFDRENDKLDADSTVYTQSRPHRYYVRGDKVHLYPVSTAGETLRIHYERLPNRLCRSTSYTYNSGTEAAEAGLITSVDTGTGVITCSGGVPSTISTSTPICAVQSTPGFGLRFSAVTPSNKTSTTVTVSTTNAALVAVGDYIALDGDSPIVQLPVEAHGILAQRLACKLLEGIEDTEGLVAATADLKQIIENYGQQFPQRNDEAPKLVAEPGHRLVDYLI